MQLLRIACLLPFAVAGCAGLSRSPARQDVTPATAQLVSDPAPPRGYGELSTIQVDQGAYRFAGYACRGEQPLEFATTDAAFAAGLLIGSSVIKAGDYAHGLRGLVRREHFDFALDPELAYFRWLSFLAHHEQRVLDGLGCDWCDAHRP